MKPGSKKMAAVGSVHSVDRHYRDAQAVLDALFRCRHERQEPAPRASARQASAGVKNKRIRAMLSEKVDDGSKKVTLDTVTENCDRLNQKVDLCKVACQGVGRGRLTAISVTLKWLV